MTRKKVKLAYITNDSARKATFKKRKKGLMKKVSELSTLCGIDACAIIYSPYDSQPEVWPSPAGAHRVLSKFRKMPEMEQSKKMVNQESFLRQRISKARDQLKKQLKENREKEVANLMYRALAGKASLHALSLPDLHDLGWLLDHYLNDIHRRMDSFGLSGGSGSSGGSTGGAGESNHQQDHLQAASAVGPEVGNLGAEAMQSHRWLMELLNSSSVNGDQSINNQGGFGGGDGSAVTGGAGEDINMMLPLIGDATNNYHSMSECVQGNLPRGLPENGAGGTGRSCRRGSWRSEADVAGDDAAWAAAAAVA
ncbi:agamous-like MADS-box protein AGL80 [Malania oleifera]|uniref:agamous-like MADS-box protein AGL80 n=1 Tax=Malania oleifera TaxID=397392 RepID=UPI0025AEC6E2|nr:agamous-like MADS-box protein AGL80 [Malania oleifera]